MKNVFLIILLSHLSSLSRSPLDRGRRGAGEGCHHHHHHLTSFPRVGGERRREWGAFSSSLLPSHLPPPTLPSHLPPFFSLLSLSLSMTMTMTMITRSVSTLRTALTCPEGQRAWALHSLFSEIFNAGRICPVISLQASRHLK